MISDQLASILVFALLLAMLAAGFPIALALAGSGGIVLLLMGGSTAFTSIPLSLWQMINHYVLVAIPLFIFMGNILIYSGLSSELMEMFSRWLSRISGGLGISAIYSCAVFGAMSGSTSAACATIGGMAIPEMRQRGYSTRIACGTLASAGGLAILIPPSGEMIMYSVVSELSVGHLFMAGVFPGLVLATLMALYLFIMAKISRGSAPPTYSVPWQSRFASLGKVWPAALLVIGVLGGIYTGVMTPTEAAAGGAFLAWLLVTFYYRTFNWKRMWDALMRTIQISGMVFMIIAGSGVFGLALIWSKFPQDFATWMLGISTIKWVILAVICLMFIIAGTFLTVTAITFTIVPLVLPIINSLGFDPIVFAITFTILAETALVTPPVGINLYVISGVAKDARLIEDIALGALPFVLIMCITIVILWLFPQLCLWLPSTM